MTTGSQPKFSRVVVGYDPVAVDACIDELIAKQQLLLDDIETLRARLKESCDEVAALRKEVAFLNDTSPSPHAVPQRMSKLLRHAIDEVSEMQAEAKAEVQALVATIESEAETAHRKHEELLADMAAQRSALDAECAETRSQLEAECAETRRQLEEELAGKRAEAQSEIDDAMQKAQQERDQLLAEARQEAERLREEARRVVDEASAQRIKILEQLMDVYRGVETIPAALESAYQDRDKPPEAGVVVPFEQKRSTG